MMRRWPNGQDAMARHWQVHQYCPVALGLTHTTVGGRVSPLSADDAGAVVPQVLPPESRRPAVDLGCTGLSFTDRDEEVRSQVLLLPHVVSDDFYFVLLLGLPCYSMLFTVK